MIVTVFLDDFTIYRCDERYKPNMPCSGAVNVYADDTYAISGHHNHDPKPGSIEKHQVKKRMRDHIKMNPHAKPKEVMDLATVGVSDEARAALPKIRSIARTIQRQKSQLLFKIPNARTTEQLNIKALLEVTVNNESILYDDNKKPGNERFLIFATKKNLKRFRRCRLISCDATYKVVFTNLFYLIFFIESPSPLLEALDYTWPLSQDLYTINFCSGKRYETRNL